MRAVLDSNVLFRTLISHGSVVTLVFNPKLELFAPERLKEEFARNREDILSKTRLSESEFEELAAFLFSQIAFIPLGAYRQFIPKAKSLLGSHQKDEDFVALCLLKGCKIWTYESLLFEREVGISTKQLAKALDAE